MAVKNSITSNGDAPSDRYKWTVAVVIAGIFAVLSAAYVAALGVGLGTLLAWSFISAAVASLMFAVALSMGSFYYYIGWPNVRHGYQKQIGVMAFWLAAFYSLTLMVLYPELYWYGLKDNLFSSDIIFGVSAMFIFALMVGINSKVIAPHFKWETIKFILGLGYVGYALLVIRSILIEWAVWELWLVDLAGFPPGRMVLALIALVVLLLRISIPIHKRFFKSS